MFRHMTAYMTIPCFPSLWLRLIKGITPDIKSSRCKAPPKSALPKEIQMSESSARLLKNASFLTNNTSSFNIENHP